MARRALGVELFQSNQLYAAADIMHHLLLRARADHDPHVRQPRSQKPSENIAGFQRLGEAVSWRRHTSCP